jgi:hypothetical protein
VILTEHVLNAFQGILSDFISIALYLQGEIGKFLQSALRLNAVLLADFQE